MPPLLELEVEASGGDDLAVVDLAPGDEETKQDAFAPTVHDLQVPDDYTGYGGRVPVSILIVDLSVRTFT